MKAMKAAMKRRDRTGEYRKRNKKRASDTRVRVRTDARKGRLRTDTRVRVRTDARKGRLCADTRVRKSRVQKREQNTLRCLNVQRPWAQLLVTGVKAVEVRKYPLTNYRHEDLWVVETKGADRDVRRDLEARIVGTIRFERNFKYKSLAHFREDKARHCIDKGSAFDWDTDKIPRMYGWEVSNARPFSRPLMPPAVKGVIGASALTRRGTPSSS